MLNFKPLADEAVDLVESSDDVGGIAAEDGSDAGSSDDSSDDDDEDIADVGDEPGVAVEQEQNPFFDGSDSDGSDVSDTSDEEEDGAAGGTKEPVDEEDDLIKAIREAREKKVRSSPPDIKTSDMITDISFHPEADLIALGSMSGDLSIFRWV